MSMEFIESLQSMVIVIVGVFATVVLVAIVIWSKTYVGTMETRSSADALAEKGLSDSCISTHDAENISEKFIFNKTVLDKYNNSALPCTDMPGSFYFIEVKSNIGTWQFSNSAEYPYAYNAIVRGLTKGCISVLPFSTAADMKSSYPDPFNFNYNNYNGGILSFSASVINGEDNVAASVLIIMDTDSGTKFYPSGFPLCLGDVACPNTPVGKCFCVKSSEAAVGKVCGG